MAKRDPRHALLQETALFPALRTIVTPNEDYSLGEDFERKEHQLFGKGGFKGLVEEVATIEKSMGIDDLAQFTSQS